MSCEVLNAYWNNATNPPNQAAIFAAYLPIYSVYVFSGMIASLFNIICIFIFITKKELRKKYIFFTVLAFGNLINTLYLGLNGILNRQMIYSNQLVQSRSSFECLLRPGPHLQLFGGQLPALVILVIDIERFIAVYKPFFYKLHFHDRTRLSIAFGCFGVVFVSQLFGYLCSYLNRNNCTSSTCLATGTYGLDYNYYNWAVVILFPLFAFILNIITYIRTKRLGEYANKKKDLRMILITLIITFVDVLFIAFPNIILLGATIRLFTVSYILISYVYVFFSCNSLINLFVYICLKHDFRNHFLMSISFGTLRPYLKVTNEIGQHNGISRSPRVAPMIGSNTAIRSTFRMPIPVK